MTRVLIVGGRRCGKSWVYEQLKAMADAGRIELVEPDLTATANQLGVEAHRLFQGELGHIEQFKIFIDELPLEYSIYKPDVPKIKTYGPPVKGKKGKLKRW